MTVDRGLVACLTLVVVGCTGGGPEGEDGPEHETETGTEPQDEIPTTPDAGAPLEPECVDFRDLDISWSAATHAPAVVRGPDLRYVADDCSAAEFDPDEGAAIEHAALEVLRRLEPLFGVTAQDTFEVRHVADDELGFHHVRVVHRHGTAAREVIGSALIVHFDADGRAYEVNGRFAAAAAVAESATLDEDAATAAARAHFAAAHGEPRESSPPRLVVFARAESPALAWMLEVGDGATSRREYSIDASTGSVLAAYDLVRTELPEGDGEAATITGNGLAREGDDVVAVTGWHHLDTGDHYLHGEELAWSVHEPGDDCFTAGDITHRSGADWGSSDPAALSVAFNLEQTIAYFDDTHAFTGWDGEGGHTVAIVRYACYQPNAFYIGDGLIAFGVGGGPLFDLGVADVVAHEFTHAVTGSTANLVYQGEPGALNESFSDIFGSAFELGSQVDNRAAYPATAPGTADWLIAEDAGTAPLRDMRNPGSMSVLTPSPSRYEGTLWKDPTDIDFDYGGVHFNSGVQNHFFYLLAEGGAGTNDGIAYELDALGLDSAASIAFRALAHYTHADSDYAEIREAWLSAAFDLQHLDPERDWVAAVDLAWTAVGVTTDFCPSWHRDGDGDGFGDPDQTMAACSRPDGWVADATDCDDGDVRVFPDASEVCDDGVLNACTPPDDVCGEVEIAVAPPNVSVTWQSDCVLQTADEVAGPFFDYAGAVTQNGCDREALFSTAAPMQFFRLRTP